jgi:hypothetical protein
MGGISTQSLVRLIHPPSFCNPQLTALAEWMMFAAGLVPDTATRNKLISSVVYFLSSGPCTLPWCDKYQVNTGDVLTEYVNRPVVGGVYSLLARDLPVRPLGATSNPTNSAMAFSVPITIFLVSDLSHDVAHSLIHY